MAINSDAGPCVNAEIAAGIPPAAALFHSLADETRLKIVQRLARGEARVVDLTDQLGLAQSTVSRHLACLRDCGLVDYRAEGRQSFYALTRPELLDLLGAAEQLLAATGHTVTLCPASDPARLDRHATAPMEGEPVA
ncbi:putative transcriptional regulator, ArsR family protein [Acrocarpospora corrugata]|uniref:Putative transcriptional regulator, ArsR family protein n=1 Tax=Acrocarpospora corrugata TaxID=35763 RepID=A0A5M3VYQ6_9ACTN|nr:metalloregulator ArsR/SmtB family transcription factor [Acrocarpospora corrugata]GES00852.1 putative transcriptional regulator, ArsR family protein [Acrocarpospora corrugata]